jgi:hypothetical protein
LFKYFDTKLNKKYKIPPSNKREEAKRIIAKVAIFYILPKKAPKDYR